MNIHIHINWIQEKVHIQYIYVEFCPTFSKSIPSNPTRSEIRSIDVSSKTKNKKQVHRVIQLTNSSSANITIAIGHQPQRASSSSVRSWVTARSEAARRAHHWLCCCSMPVFIKQLVQLFWEYTIANDVSAYARCVATGGQHQTAELLHPACSERRPLHTWRDLSSV